MNTFALNIALRVTTANDDLLDRTDYTRQHVSYK